MIQKKKLTSSKGIGYIFYQNANENKPGEDVTIISANSSALKESQLSYSLIDCEVLALKFALDASHHYVYGAKQVHIYTDCSSLEGLFDKQLGEIKNKRIRNIVEKLMPGHLYIK